MTRGKLIKAAISSIIKKRDDLYVNYTFEDIVTLLKRRFLVV